MRKTATYAVATMVVLTATVVGATTITNESGNTQLPNFQGNWNIPASGLVNVVNPLASPNQVNTSEWTMTATGPNDNTPDFATSGNDNEKWSKVFDHSAQAGSGPWGNGTSKVCCNNSAPPNENTVAMVSSTSNYSFVGYELTLSNDTPSRDPKDFTFYGTTDHGATWTPIDSQTGQFNVDPGRNSTFLYTLDSPTALYNGFKFDFTATQGGFALAEIEVFSAAVPEPSCVVLFGLGAIGLLAVARRRRSA